MKEKLTTKESLQQTIAEHGGIGDYRAPKGSLQWAIAIRNGIQSSIRDTATSATRLNDLLGLMREYKGYTNLHKKDGQPFHSLEEFCFEKQPWGLGYDIGILNRIITERQQRQRSRQLEEVPQEKPIVDPEFKSLIQPLTLEEFKLLEANIIQEGCRDALVVWVNHNILVDGHHRLQVCSKHNISFKVNEIEFSDRQAAINWIINNQIGRRNLTPEQQSYLRGKRYNSEKKQGRRSDLTSPHCEEKLQTSEILANEYKVSRATIERDAHFAEAVDIVAAAVGSEARGQILGRESKLTKQDTRKLAVLAEISPEETRNVLAGIRDGNGRVPKQIIEHALIKTATSGNKEESLDLKIEHKRQVEERICLSPPPMPEGRFDVIVIDPPWPYECRQEDRTHRGRLAYPSMPLDQILAFPVKDLVAENCILWLWATNTFMSQAFECLQAWGFEHKTILTWVKTQMGLGDWLRNQTEHCLLAVKGKPQSFSRSGRLKDQTTVLYAPRREHSRKPDEFFELVQELCPLGSRLELFGRQSRPGWTVHGAESDFFDD